VEHASGEPASGEHASGEAAVVEHTSGEATVTEHESRDAAAEDASGRLPPASKRRGSPSRSMRRGREIIADEHTETCVRDFRQRAQIYVCEEEVSIAYRYLGAHNSELVSYRRCGARMSAQLGYMSSLSVSIPVSVFNLVATVVITL
jgi:hypothetical protein